MKPEQQQRFTSHNPNDIKRTAIAFCIWRQHYATLVKIVT